MIKGVGREIAEFKPYKTIRAKLLGAGWRFGFATIILFLLIGIGPIEIFQKLVGAFTEQEKTINVYSTLSTGNWQNTQNVQGQPDVDITGNFNSFSEVNSAVYQGESLSLVLSGFNKTQVDLEKNIKTEINDSEKNEQEELEQQQQEQEPELELQQEEQELEPELEPDLGQQQQEEELELQEELIKQPEEVEEETEEVIRKILLL